MCLEEGSCGRSTIATQLMWTLCVLIFYGNNPRAAPEWDIAWNNTKQIRSLGSLFCGNAIFAEHALAGTCKARHGTIVESNPQMQANFDWSFSGCLVSLALIAFMFATIPSNDSVLAQACHWCRIRLSHLAWYWTACVMWTILFAYHSYAGIWMQFPNGHAMPRFMLTSTIWIIYIQVSRLHQSHGRFLEPPPMAGGFRVHSPCESQRSSVAAHCPDDGVSLHLLAVQPRHYRWRHDAPISRALDSAQLWVSQPGEEQSTGVSSTVASEAAQCLGPGAIPALIHVHTAATSPPNARLHSKHLTGPVTCCSWRSIRLVSAA